MDTIRTMIRVVLKHEIWLFYFLVLLNLVPLFSGVYFPSMDGPAHLYNSRLLYELISGESSLINQFYQINGLVPNLSGHAFLALFMTFLPPHLAEKSFLILYAISLPLSFRYLLKSSPKVNVQFSFLILPFVYSYLFLLGFYNFSISLVFLFLSLGYWLRYRERNTNLIFVLLFSTLCFLTYTSHLIVYGLLVAFLVAQIAIAWVSSYVDKTRSGGITNILELKNVAIVLATNLIPLTYTITYFLNRPQSGYNYTYISGEERITFFTDLRPLIAFNYEIESSYTRVLFWLFIVLLIVGLVWRLRKLHIQYKSNQHSKQVLYKLINHPSLFAVMICLTLLIAFFVLPDSDGFGGFISVRMLLLFFIFLIYWFASTIPQRWVPIACIPIILYVVVNMNSYYSEVIGSLDPYAQEITEVSALLEPESIILPLNSSTNWLQGHFSNYLGAKQPMVILENYEAHSDYFAVKWNSPKPGVFINSDNINQYTNCFTGYLGDAKNVEHEVDYIFVLGKIEDLSPDCHTMLAHFQPVVFYESSTIAILKASHK